MTQINNHMVVHWNWLEQRNHQASLRSEEQTCAVISYYSHVMWTYFPLINTSILSGICTWPVCNIHRQKQRISLLQAILFQLQPLVCITEYKTSLLACTVPLCHGPGGRGLWHPHTEPSCCRGSSWHHSLVLPLGSEDIFCWRWCVDCTYVLCPI